MIKIVTLDEFCIRDPRTVKRNLTMVKILDKVPGNELGLET